MPSAQEHLDMAVNLVRQGETGVSSECAGAKPLFAHPCLEPLGIADVQAGEHVAAKTSDRLRESTGSEVRLEQRDVGRETSRIETHFLIASRAGFK